MSLVEAGGWYVAVGVALLGAKLVLYGSPPTTAEVRGDEEATAEDEGFALFFALFVLLWPVMLWMEIGEMRRGR